MISLDRSGCDLVMAIRIQGPVFEFRSYSAGGCMEVIVELYATFFSSTCDY